MKSITLASRFTVLRQLGSGGFSQVYKVEDKTQNNQVFALKILNFTIDQEGVAEEIKVFNKEVEYLKKLKHNSIVRIQEDLIIDNKPAILMELVEGQSLQQCIDAQKVLSAQEVMDIAKQISAALLASHTFQIPREKLGLDTETILLDQYAIVHNDISAKNIIKQNQEDGSAVYKLIDFGLSYVPNEVKSGENKSQGTLEYYPPEKWKGDKVDTRSDIYSFGVVLYQMLAGKVPFEIDNYGDFTQVNRAKEHHIASPLPDVWETRKANLLNNQMLTSENPDYPYWFQQLIEKCLAKNPKDRFRTGEDLNRFYQKGRRGDLEHQWPTQTNHEEEDAWLNAYGINTINAYEDFIQQYPNSKHVAQANEEIDYLKQIERGNKLEQIEWEKAQQTHTVVAYQNFVAKYPNSTFVTEAKNNIQILEEETTAWQLAQEKNTKKAYEQFLKKYPNSQFVKLAQQKKGQIGESSILEKIKNNLTVIIIVFVLLSFVVIEFGFMKNTNKPEEPIGDPYKDVITDYYNAKYVDNDIDLILNKCLHFPLSYNGQAFDKDSYSQRLKNNNFIANVLRTKNDYKIINKKLIIDSLIPLDSTRVKVKVYGHYSFIKKKKDKRGLQKINKIEDEITIKEGRISGIKNNEK